MPFNRRQFSIIRLRRIAPRLLRRLPRPRCAVRRCPDATTADGQPLMSASSGLRHTARRGRLTLKPQADFRDSLSLHKFHDTLCVVHSKPPTLLWLSYLRYAPHRHHRPSPRSTPRLDKYICVKGERCFRVRSNPRAEFPRARKRFYRASGSLRGGRSAYSEGAKGGKGKTSDSAVGAGGSHYGGKPPNPLTRYHSVQTQLQAATKSRIL